MVRKLIPMGLGVGVIKIGMQNGMLQKDFADTLIEDVKIREYVKKKEYNAGVSG